MLVRLLCPFLYSLVLGCVWGGWFKKKFSSSLAIAFMTHILLVMMSGLIFQRLSIGVYGGIVLAIILGIVLVVKNRTSVSKQAILQYIKTNWNEGVFIFTLFYVFCFVFNYGKRFTSWDEFSHWGMFLKESLRLDSLYCMSPLVFAHKDYVPAVTLFEVIWCKLNGGFAEHDAYRAIQVFMFSLLMPMFEKISEFSLKKIEDGTSIIAVCKNRFFQLGAVLVVLLVPLMCSEGVSFYHSIYCDTAVGIIFFWCVFEAYREQKDIAYQFLLMIIGISVLVLSKMIAMALVPLVLALFVVRFFFLSNEKPKGKYYACMIPVVIVPVGLWYWFNKFVDGYVDNTGGIQSYDGMKLSSIKEVFINPMNSSITYLKQVKNAYIDNIYQTEILVHGSYVMVIAAIIIAFLIMSCLADDLLNRRKILIAGAWTTGAGIYYALLMYFLYCTAFSEYEAVRLASYGRYMCSFVIAIILFLIAVYYESGIWKKYVKGYCWLIIILFLDLTFHHVSTFEQVLPGTITRDNEKISGYLKYADKIMNITEENEKIFIVKRGDDGDFIWHQRYYCSPRIIGGGSFGPAVYDGDIWTSDKTVEEFVELVNGYDYIFFCGLDNIFIEKYSVGFSNPELLVDGEIYKISNVDSQIYLEQSVDKRSFFGYQNE